MAFSGKNSGVEKIGGLSAEEDFANFLKSKKLDSISLILLDILIPLQRPAKALLSVFEPLSGLLFGRNVSEKMNFFASEESSFDELRDALERGLK